MNSTRPSFRSFFLSLTCLAMGLLSSCTVVNGDRNKGTYSMGTVGGDLRDYVQTPEAVAAGSIQNSASFEKVTKLITSGIYASAAKSILSNAASAYKSVQAGKDAAAVSKHAAEQATKQAAIQADVTKATFVPPEEVVPAVVPAP